MASPLPSGKQSVNLVASNTRGPKGLGVSKIRRDPPPAVKEVEVADPDKRDARTVLLGILAFTLVLLIILIGLSRAVGWSPRDTIAYL